MSKALSLIVKIKLNGPLTAESRAMLDAMTSGVEANEPNTLVYDWFLSEDGLNICVLERYTDTSAVVTHSKAQTPEFREKMATIGSMESMIVLGEPDEPLAGMLKKGGATIMAPLTGFYR